MRHLSGVIAAGLICVSVLAVADDITVLQDRSGKTTSDKPDPHPKLIVTKMGRILEGDISYSAGGYAVDVSGGSILVPFKLVKFTADSRHDAYLKYRKLMPQETSGNHVTLAKWCLKYGLKNDAIHELKQALFLDEANRDAEKLLAYLKNQQAGQTASSVRKRSKQTGSTIKNAVSLQGLTPEAVSEYNTRIQPILMNNCAKAGCHHRRAKNDFRLHYVRLTGYGNRIASSENLEQVLEQIDLEQPQKSPLLVKAQSNHGEAGNTLVKAPRGREILDRIERWVSQASRELNPQSQETQKFATDDQSNANQTSSPNRNGQRRITQDSLPADREQFIENILKKRRDPFSPQKFHRSMTPSGN